MHSTLNRAQGVFGFFTTVALFVAGFAALSVLLMPATDAKAEVELKNVQVYASNAALPTTQHPQTDHTAESRAALTTTRARGRSLRRSGLTWTPVLPPSLPPCLFPGRTDANIHTVDLSPLFNWNTKQLFVYVFASYPSSAESTAANSESIIWDTVIPAAESPYSVNKLTERFFPRKVSKPKRGLAKKKPESSTPGVLSLRNQRPKYQISDITGRMAGTENVTLAVGWNVQPWVGALWWSPGSGAVPHTEGAAGRSAVFAFPELKGSKPKTAAGGENAV